MLRLISAIKTIISSPTSHIILLKNNEMQDFIEQIDDSYTLSTRLKIVQGAEATCTIDFFNKDNQRKRIVTEKLQADKEFLKEFSEPGIYKIVVFCFSKTPVLLEISMDSDFIEDKTKQNREIKNTINKVFNELDKSYWSGLKTLRLKNEIHKTVSTWKFRAYFLFLLTPLYLAIAYGRHLYLKSFFTVKSESI